MGVVFLTYLEISLSISCDPSIMLAKKRAEKTEGEKKAILELNETFLSRLSEGTLDRAYP